MAGIEIPLSVSNAGQLDQQQDHLHRTPVIHQVQNADSAREEIARRLTKPVEPDKLEGKLVDSGDRKNDDASKKKGRKREQKQSAKSSPKSTGGGLFIDLNA